MFDFRDPGLWVRVATFIAAVLALVPQFFELTPIWERGLAFTIAVINLALTIFGPKVVSWWTARRARLF